MRRTVAFPVLMALAGLVPGSAARADSLAEIDRDFAEAAEGLTRATVHLVGEGAAKDMPGSSGVILHPDGWVLSDADATMTGLAVEEGASPRRKAHAERATVRLPDGKTYPAVLVKRDPDTDSSLLKIVPEGEAKFRCCRPGASSGIGVGSWAILCGNSFGTAKEGRPALSVGVIAAVVDGQFVTSAAVNPGSNGGPCADAEGRLVGIVSTWGADPASPWNGFGILTPIDRIRERYRDVKDFEKVFPDLKAPPARQHRAGALEEAFRAVARQAAPSVVSITFQRDASAPRTESITLPDKRTIVVPRYTGPVSGVIVDASGLVATACANLWARESIEGATVHLPDGRDLPAKILGRDQVLGVALLQADAEGLPCLEPAAPAGVKVGQFAFALGNPFGERRAASPFFTFGVVSALHQLDRNRDALQTDAGMNDVNCGGALVDLRGRLLGICSLQSPQLYGRNSGIGFAIPADRVLASLPALKAGRDVLPGFLGVQTAEAAGKVLIVSVVEGSPAAALGLCKDDAIAAINGRAIENALQFRDVMGSLRAGDEAELRVVRSEEALTLKVVLGARPEER